MSCKNFITLTESLFTLSVNTWNLLSKKAFTRTKSRWFTKWNTSINWQTIKVNALQYAGKTNCAVRFNSNLWKNLRGRRMSTRMYFHLNSWVKSQSSRLSWKTSQIWSVLQPTKYQSFRKLWTVRICLSFNVSSTAANPRSIHSVLVTWWCSKRLATYFQWVLVNSSFWQMQIQAHMGWRIVFRWCDRLVSRILTRNYVGSCRIVWRSPSSAKKLLSFSEIMVQTNYTRSHLQKTKTSLVTQKIQWDW